MAAAISGTGKRWRGGCDRDLAFAIAEPVHTSLTHTDVSSGWHRAAAGSESTQTRGLRLDRAAAGFDSVGWMADPISTAVLITDAGRATR